MLIQLANATLCLLLVIILFRESKRFSITTSIYCILLGLTALVLQTIDLIQKWTQ